MDLQDGQRRPLAEKPVLAVFSRWDRQRGPSHRRLGFLDWMRSQEDAMRTRRIVFDFLLHGAGVYTAVNSGCAFLQRDCAQDGYEAGQRDGRFGAQAWDVQYADRCGGRFDRSRYVSGWQAGVSARPSLGGQGRSPTWSSRYGTAPALPALMCRAPWRWSRLRARSCSWARGRYRNWAAGSSPPCWAWTVAPVSMSRCWTP